MTDLTNLGVAAIRDGVAAGEFTAREVATSFNANVAAAQAALNAFIVATPDKAYIQYNQTNINKFTIYLK